MSTSTSTQPSTPKPNFPSMFTTPIRQAQSQSTSSTLIEAFESDPVTAYMLNHLPQSSRLAARQDLYSLYSRATVKAGGKLWSDGTFSASSTLESDFQAAAIIFTRGKSPDDLGTSFLPGFLPGSGLAPALWPVGPNSVVSKMNAYDAATMPSEKATFPSEEIFFYVRLIGAGTQHRGKGPALSLIEKLQDRVKKERKSIYLEAANVDARSVYEKLRFEETGEKA